VEKRRILRLGSVFVSIIPLVLIGSCAPAGGYQDVAGEAQVNFWTTVLVTVFVTIIISSLLYFFRYFVIVHIGHSLIEKVLICFPGARNISGTWKTEFRKGKERYTEIAKVSQLFGKVWGTIRLDEAPARKYRMAGSIREGVLVASYEIVEPKEILDRGAFTLRLSPDGQKLKGCGSWTDDETTVPQGHQYVWTKPLHRGEDGIRIKKSSIHGKGVFANIQYVTEAEVGYFYGYEVERGTRHSLTLERRVIEGTGPLRFLNHSCNPNCYFKGRTLITKRAVSRREELTINYLDYESAGHLRHPFECRCKCSNCLKRIG
jgi:hypothetical protein